MKEGAWLKAAYMGSQLPLKLLHNLHFERRLDAGKHLDVGGLQHQRHLVRPGLHLFWGTTILFSTIEAVDLSSPFIRVR